MSSKSYTVMMNGEILLGPLQDYGKVKAFLDGLNPAIKTKCTVKVGTSEAQSQPEEEVVAQPVKSEKPQVKVHSPAVASVDVNNVFGAYLEGGGQSDFWKPKDGRNLIRILPIGGVLPSDWTTPYPLLLSGVHSNVGLSLRETIYCPRLTHNQACPICNFVWKLYNTKNENDLKLARNIKGYNRVLANIIDLADIESGVQKFAFGKTLARKIMTYMEDPEFMPLLDAETGHNFIVIKKKVDNYPNYDDSRPEVKTMALAQIFPKWKESAYDLKKEIVEKTYDELMKVLTDTKKAILSTSSEDLFNHNEGKSAGADDSTDGASSVTEVSAEDLDNRLNKL